MNADPQICPQCGAAHEAIDLHFIPPDASTRKIMLAIVRKYNLEPYRLSRQRKLNFAVRILDHDLAIRLKAEINTVTDLFSAKVNDLADHFIENLSSLKIEP